MSVEPVKLPEWFNHINHINHNGIEGLLTEKNCANSAAQVCLTIVCSFLRVLANSVSISTREPTSMGVELGSCANDVISRASCLHNRIYHIIIVKVLSTVLCKMSLSFALSFLYLVSLSQSLCITYNGHTHV